MHEHEHTLIPYPGSPIIQCLVISFSNERKGKEGAPHSAQHLGFWPQKRHTRRSGCRRRRLNNDPSKKDYCPNMNIRQSPLSPLLSLSHLMPCHTKKWEGMVRQKREENMSCRIGRIKNYDCVLDRLFLCPSPQRRERGFEEERKSEKGFKVNNRQWQNI